MRDRGDATQRLVVGDDVGLGGVEMVDRGGHVSGVPDLDGVDEDLEAEGVPAVVIFVGGDLGAGADHEVTAQGAERLALVELAVDPGSERGIGAVAQQEDGADDPAYSPSATASGLWGVAFFRRVISRLAGTQPRLSNAAVRSRSSYCSTIRAGRARDRSTTSRWVGRRVRRGGTAGDRRRLAGAG
jgi:hypothetical protein